jgi:rubrerythrin
MSTKGSSEQAIAALNKAIKGEKTGLESYLKFARSTRSQSGKDMFIRLAQDEFGHMELLEKERNRLQQGKKWVGIDIAPSDIEEVVPRLSSQQAKIKAEQGTSDDLTALNIALDLERKAADFYMRQGNRESDVTAKQIFFRLAEMEESHYNLIQAEIDSINDIGFWFGIREFSLESS